MSLHTLVNTPLSDVYKHYQRFTAIHGSLDVYFTGHVIEVGDNTVVYTFEEPVLIHNLSSSRFDIALHNASFRWTMRLPGAPKGRPIYTVVKGRQQAQNRFEFCQQGHKPNHGTPTRIDGVTALAAQTAATGKPTRSYRESQSIHPTSAPIKVVQHTQTHPLVSQTSSIASYYTAVMRWYGPFTRHDIETTQKHRGRGLYLFSGRLNHHKAPQVLYCGMTTGLFRTRFANHEKLACIPQANLAIWLGNPLYPERPSTALLQRAEYMMIYFLQPELNGYGRMAPSKATTLVSYWHNTTSRPPLVSSQTLPEIVSYDGKDWYKGNLAKL